MTNQQPKEIKTVVKREKTIDLRIGDKWTFNPKFESTVALPNDLFDTLIDLEDNKILKKGHAQVAYAYMFLQTWLWRYAQYSEHIPSAMEVKQLLGFDKGEKRINYIVKKDGILDNEGLTETTNDFPMHVTWEWNDETGERDSFPTINTLTSSYPEFYDLKEILKERGINSRLTCKKPLHLYERENYEGTLYDASRTTQIDIRAFDFCMKHVKELGLTGFFLYAYIVYMDGIFENGFDASVERLANELMMDKKTITKYRDALRAHNMIELKHNNAYFNPDDVMLAPTNIPNEWWQFTDEKGAFMKFNSKEHKAHSWNNPMEYESVRRKFKKDTDEIKINGITINQLDLPF